MSISIANSDPARDVETSLHEADATQKAVTKGKRESFTSIQASRGLAALLVVFVHIEGSIFNNVKYFNGHFFPFFKMGDSGVQFFFVLSGFIILHVHWNDLGKAFRAQNFLLKRFIRIYPIYWIVLIPIIATYFSNPAFGTGTETSWPRLLSSITLAPYPEKPVLGVAWTLQHEVLFYALFLTLIYNLRLGLAVLGAWLVGCVAWTIAGPDTFPGNFFFSHNNILFFFGMGCAAILRTNINAHAGKIAVLGAAIFFGAGLVRVYGPYDPKNAAFALLYGAGSALAVYGLVSLERTGRIQAPPALRFFGDASYSTYLVHLACLSATAKVIFHFGLQSEPHWISFVLLVSVALACGAIVHQVVEKPLMKSLSRFGRA